MGHDGVGGHTPPVDAHGEEHAQVGQQSQAQELEDAGDEVEGPAHHQGGDEQPGRGRPQPGGAGVEQVHARAHGHQVGGDVEGIGHDQSAQQHPDDDAARGAEAAGRQLAQVPARGQGGAVADLLHPGHEGQGEEGGPQHPEAELGPGLGVGGDAGGVVVAGPGDQTRTQGPHVRAPQGSAGPGGVEPAPRQLRSASLGCAFHGLGHGTSIPSVRSLNRLEGMARRQRAGAALASAAD